MKMGEVTEGMQLRVKDSSLDSLLVEMRKKVEGRVGIVERTYRPMGGQMIVVIRFQKHTSRGKDFTHKFNLSFVQKDMEAV